MATVESVEEELNVLREAVNSIQQQVEKLADAITNHEAVIKECNLAHWKDLEDTCASTQRELDKVTAMQELYTKSHKELMSELENMKVEVAKVQRSLALDPPPGIGEGSQMESEERKSGEKTKKDKIDILFSIVNSMADSLGNRMDKQEVKIKTEAIENKKQKC